MRGIETATSLVDTAFWQSLPPANASGARLADVSRNDGWTICGEMVDLLVRIAADERCSSILEFGAGRSSLAFAGVLSRKRAGRLTSVDHDPRFCHHVWEQVQKTGVDARLLVSPLGRRLTRFGLLTTYLGLRPRLEERAPYDLLFVDAPPGHIGRDATLYEALPFLAPDAVIVLDDAAREREQTTMRRWLRHIRGLTVVAFDPAFGRGVGILTLKQQGTRFSLRSFFGSIDDEVRRHRRA